MVNCMCSDQFKIVFGLNYRKSGTGPSPSQKAAADPVLQLPVIPVRRGVIAEKALNRRHTLSSDTIEIVILLQTTTLATTYIHAPINPPAAASVFF